MIKPWYYEDPKPHLFNEWTLVHLGTGMLFGCFFPKKYVAGFLLHTAYESVEGELFPIRFRDASMRNHIGDSLAFMAGLWLASRIQCPVTGRAGEGAGRELS